MAAEVDSAGRRKKRPGEPPLASYVDKDATRLQKEMTAWLKKETGYDADEKSVALTMALRMKFQASEENQKNLTSRRAELEKERTEREERRAARTSGRKATAVDAPKRRRPKPAAEPDAA